MSQEDKQLLLKDLCARLPYGVEMVCEASKISLTLSTHMLGEIIKDGNELQWKPYLRSMSSMTEKEKEEYEMLQVYPGFRTNHTDLTDMYDWLLAHHFDYRGLIHMGLALEAPDGMYKN